MEIILAKSAGFCFGVNRAMDTVYKNIQRNDSNIYTLGPIIHNKQVVEELQSKGVQTVEQIDEIDHDEATKLIIRTHGIPKSVYDEIEAKNIRCIDATCPDVKKIHHIVEEYYHKGYGIIIVGNPEHPEVLSINGWCDNTAAIINSLEDMDSECESFDKVCVVAQTTFNRDKWHQISASLKKKCPQIEIFDTICNATHLRQTEAEKIAKQVDLMLVIGGMHSSNTQKLAEICSMYCEHTYHIETFEELPQNINYTNKKIGITAGASTPAWIIKEVINKMSEKEKLQDDNTEMSFEEAFEKSLITLNTGDIVKGTIIGVSNTEAYVDLGYKSDGVVTLNELADDPSAKIEDLVKVGDEIEVFVVRVNDGEGNVLLSKRKLDLMKGWETIEEAHQNQTVLDGKVIQIVNGGVMVLAKSIRVFVPASQLSDRYVPDLNQYLHQSVSLKIIDLNKRKKRVVGSVKVVIQEENAVKMEAFWSDIEVGKKYSGTVKKLTNFGAFVNLGAVDGLIHISELSWIKIKHPSEVIKEGDIAEVYVIDFDKEKNKISLGFKKAEDNPWEIAKSKFHLEDVVTCKVVRLVPFGAFAQMIPGVDGLIHISQISNKRIGKPEEVLSVGQEVEAKITELDIENQKISLSIRELLPPAEPEVKEDAAETKGAEEDDTPKEYTEEVKVTIGDAINQKKDLEE